MLDDPQGRFEAIASERSLLKAWTKVRDNGGGPGIDRITIDDFAKDADDRLHLLHQALTAGDYHPKPFRNVRIPKPSGGERQLAIPSIADRVVQTAAAAELSPVLEPSFETSSFAYRPGYGVGAAISRVSHYREAGYRWVAEGDIEAYYDHVRHNQLLTRLEPYVDSRTLRLVHQWLFEFSQDGVGIPQGSPIAPLLSNLYLDDVDEAIENESIKLVRFADDFVLLTRDKKHATQALNRMAHLLAQHGLHMNPRKTHIRGFEESFRFLGKVFTRALVIDAPNRDVAAKVQEHRRTRARWSPEDEAGIAAKLAPGLRPLFVLQPGRTLNGHGDGYSVHEGETELLVVPAADIGRIEVGPYAEVDRHALEVAATHRTPVDLVDGHGNILSSVQPPNQDHAGLHLRQAELILDAEHRLAQARAFVDAKVWNQRALLKRLNRRPQDESRAHKVERACERIDRVRNQLAQCQSVDQLSGFEGEAGAIYWPALGLLLRHGWRLHTRQRPAADAPNAVLNWTASLLTRDVRAAMSRVGLHPGFAVLHGSRDRHDGGVYDLVEAFRAPLAESLSVYLFNNRMVRVSDYDAQYLSLGREVGTRLIREYQKKLEQVVKDRHHRRCTWRRMFLVEAYAYRDALRAGHPYEPYRMKF